MLTRNLDIVLQNTRIIKHNTNSCIHTEVYIISCTIYNMRYYTKSIKEALTCYTCLIDLLLKYIFKRGLKFI